MCSPGKYWWVHSPKHLHSPSSELPNPLFESSEIEWFGGGGGVMRIYDDRKVFLWIQNTILTKNMTFSRERVRGEGLIVSVKSCLSVFHIRPSSQCLPVAHSQFLIKSPRAIRNRAPLSLSCILDLLHQKPAGSVGSRANVGGSGWSSWAVIGRWHPAGSWRQLRGRELPLASASCSPFVNC